MASFRYRAVTALGEPQAGVVEDGSSGQAIAQLRRRGLTPIEVVETRAPAKAAAALRPGAGSRRAVIDALSELGVLLGAELTLDRALAICTENVSRPAEKAAFAALATRVKEGAPLSRAIAESRGLFPPMASAMAEAGEANGRLDLAIAKLAETLERTEAMRQTIATAMIYPALLMVITTLVILTMLLWVVPQFESLFSDAGAQLPPMTRLVMAASRLVRREGLLMLASLVAAVVVARFQLSQPAARQAFDRWVLRLPVLGRLVTAAEAGRFARVLGSLVDGGVPLPDAVAITRGSLTNQRMAEAIGRVTTALRQGRGLTASLAAERIFPPTVLSFVRTGEESGRLGPILEKLADALDRELRTGVERTIGIMTPLITVTMGVIVATVIASIMTAILGFNDLALGK
jgi:general secretion pathway protein F